MARRLPLFALAFPLLLGACGDRVFTRPNTYDRMLGFPSTGDPVDLNDLIRRHPELDGIVMLAPTYNELLDREKAELTAKGLPPIPEFRISAGTAFTLTVAGESQLATTYTVGPHGYVDIPLIGEVLVLNRTIHEVKEEITSRLRRYYLSPQVSVNPAAIPSAGFGGVRLHSGSILVIGTGAVNVDYVGDETIMKTLGQGGFSGTSDWRQIRVMQRPNAARGRPRGRIIIVDVMAFAFGDFRQDFPMEPDDVVFVPTKWSWWEQFDQGWGNMLRFMQGPLTIEGLKKQYQNTF